MHINSCLYTWGYVYALSLSSCFHRYARNWEFAHFSQIVIIVFKYYCICLFLFAFRFLAFGVAWWRVFFCLAFASRFCTRVFSVLFENRKNEKRYSLYLERERGSTQERGRERECVCEWKKRAHILPPKYIWTLLLRINKLLCVQFIDWLLLLTFKWQMKCLGSLTKNTSFVIITNRLGQRHPLIDSNLL